MDIDAGLIVIGSYAVLSEVSDTQSSAQFEVSSGISDKVALGAREVMAAGPLMVGMDALEVSVAAAAARNYDLTRTRSSI